MPCAPAWHVLLFDSPDMHGEAPNWDTFVTGTLPYRDRFRGNHEGGGVMTSSCISGSLDRVSGNLRPLRKRGCAVRDDVSTLK